MRQEAPLSFPSKTAYGSAEGCVVWQGECANDGGELTAFMQEAVAARLHDTGGSEELHEHLRGLSLTGMGQETLKEEIGRASCRERVWRVGGGGRVEEEGKVREEERQRRTVQE